jgi:hypothetical protein
LVDVAGVLGGLLEESLVGDEVKVGLLGAGVGLLERALVDEVTSQLLVEITGQFARRSECLDAVAVGSTGVVQVLLVDALFVARSTDGGDARLAGVDEDGVVDGFLVEADFELLVVSGECSYLGGIERVNVADDAALC